MFTKLSFALPLAVLLVAAAPAPVAPPTPTIMPPAEIAANPANHLFIDLSSGGTVEIVLRPDLAPNHIARIQTLTRQGFYNGLSFHRVVPGFMSQGGDPKRIYAGAHYGQLSEQHLPVDQRGGRRWPVAWRRVESLRHDDGHRRPRGHCQSPKLRTPG